ncbi:hypothetical protein O181_000867 [Austropuccinia psidii MF-1]|uniref:Uncharacterized protein n=1 Tax=Austropuccinia psidii MF-1 TaxID=1389203 RepID=A0A9Q3B9H0_9BASI|nr:hypothetical protein [Austropuccinia psidii MF-1]
MTLALEKRGPVASAISNPAPELPKDNRKQPKKNQKGLRKNKTKWKGQVNYDQPYPKGYRIPKLDPSAMDSVFNMASTLMDLKAK